MRSAAETSAVSGVALLLTAVLAAPVLLSPSDRVFGMAMVGRHHDPFTAMAQFGRPLGIGVYWQPVTDLLGAALARLSNPVAAYNWLVILSFPLAAIAAYLLARHLGLCTVGASVAAIAYAFAPFHVAHAAYHPHVAQTQWLPLYLLALWRCLDRASPAAVAFLACAAIVATWSNFYTGLIAGLLSPVAAGVYWFLAHRAGVTSGRALQCTIGGLLAIVATVIAYAAYAGVAEHLAPPAPAELVAFGARWWSYLMPPVAHPLLGEPARHLWTGAGVGAGLLEQQVSLGWGAIALACVGIWGAAAGGMTATAQRSIPLLVIVGVTAFACSLTPAWRVGWLTFTAPSSVLYPILPMFRAYARFGLAVQLMAVLLAGVGVDWLWHTSWRPARMVCVVLVALLAAEYVVLPSAQWRDVLPTQAHMWARVQVGPIHVLDCTTNDPESDSVGWLTGDRVRLLEGPAFSDCGEPNLSSKLAAQGFTHVIVRHSDRASVPAGMPIALEGLRSVAHFADSDVLLVTARAPTVYTVAMIGFSPREYDAEHTWRWMGPDAAWTVVNAGAATVATALLVELSAFQRPRRVDFLLDGMRVTALAVQIDRQVYEIGPFPMTPGPHELVLRPAEMATVPSDFIRHGDARPLSIAVGTWSWTGVASGGS
jgi:hypothetical protein